jgi:uncharacterized membrane protein
MPTERLELFSDAVFAIAITLLVIEIRPPEDFEHLTSGLADLWPSYVSYVLSFLLIGLAWANHQAMFAHIRVADRLLMFLNTLLLMSVAFVPFAAAVLAGSFRSGEGERVAFLLFGSTLVVGGVIFNAIWQYALRGYHLLNDTITTEEAQRLGHRFLLGPAMYVVGTLLGALLPALGLVVFGCLILFYWLPATADERLRKHP